MTRALGIYDPLVDTGRGSWVFMSKTTLSDLLSAYDRAHPEFTDISRDDVIAGWNGAAAAVAATYGRVAS